MPQTKKRDVAKEIREKSIRDNAAASANAKKQSEEELKKKKNKRPAWAEMLSDALDVFKVGRAAKKAAEK